MGRVTLILPNCLVSWPMRYLKVGSGCASAAGVAPERPVGILPVQTAVDRLPKRQSCRDPKRTIYISQWDPVFTTRKKDKRHFPALPAGVRPLVLKEKAMRVGRYLPEKPDTSPTTVLERRDIPQKHGFCKHFFHSPGTPLERREARAGRLPLSSLGSIYHACAAGATPKKRNSVFFVWKKTERQ